MPPPVAFTVSQPKIRPAILETGPGASIPANGEALRCRDICDGLIGCRNSAGPPTAPPTNGHTSRTKGGLGRNEAWLLEGVPDPALTASPRRFLPYKHFGTYSSLGTSHCLLSHRTPRFGMSWRSAS